MNKQIGVYKITNTVTGKCYVGSSKNILRRWSEHKRFFKYRKYRSSQLYQDIREFGVDQFEFSILEECSVEELKVREQYYISMLKPEYNIRKANAGVSVKYKEDISEYQREYYQANKEEAKERKRNYYQANKEKAKEHQREYYQANKDKISEYNRQYYQAHKKQQ